MPRPAEVILNNIEKLLLGWHDNTDQRIYGLCQELQKYYPERVEIANELVAKRKIARSLIEAAYKEGAGSKKVEAWEVLVARAEDLALPQLRETMDANREKGAAKKKQYLNEERDRAKNGLPLSTVVARQSTIPAVQPVVRVNTAHEELRPTSIHANDIRGLRPLRDWTLLMDETGKSFNVATPGQQGKFVGLLIDSSNPGLSPLRPGWHAADETNTEVDRVVQKILDARCGVIGFPVSSLPRNPGERWLDGMRVLVDWVLRLLPIDGPTTVNVIIEARPPYKPGMEPDAICRDALALLARAWPDRAKLINLRMSTQPKDGHPLLAYADALAFTWGSSNNSSKERRKRSGLIDTCLLNFSPNDLAACWDAWDHPGGLSPTYWTALVTSSEAQHPSSITSAILDAVAKVARRDKARWQTYLAETEQYLFGSSIILERLGAMVDWLDKAKPSDEKISDALRLVWLTVSLARSNHRGETECAWSEELTTLSGKLHDEVAPLCCQADLHRAVAATNRFDFSSSKDVLERWVIGAPAIPGLRYWAQSYSSLGQHFAFSGDLAKARNAFAEAIKAFEKLSDRAVREKEIDQTSCYAAIAAMDDISLDNSNARAKLEDYLKNLDASVERLAASNEIEQYRHHTLLRWIVTCQDEELGQAYLSQRKNWHSGSAHPWPLIEIYRAMLLYPCDKEGALKHAQTAAAIAFGSQQGPTVRLIGACCRAVCVAWGDSWREADSVLPGLRQLLPTADERIKQLESFLKNPYDPLKLFHEVLPFNFR